jgi:hypothetical protein|tara:strand:+ start:221 stop:535 length:315 start_codon:yes stop_codon:yes gene_type:complete
VLDVFWGVFAVGVYSFAMIIAIKEISRIGRTFKSFDKRAIGPAIFLFGIVNVWVAIGVAISLELDSRVVGASIFVVLLYFRSTLSLAMPLLLGSFVGVVLVVVN